jgi:hypothetical protein
MLRATAGISSDKQSNSNTSVPTPLSEGAGRIERLMHIGKNGQVEQPQVTNSFLQKCSLNAANDVSTNGTR